VATIVRGQDGTVAVAHSGGATFDQVAIAKDLDEANAHTSANSGVHGISGSVVGTTDAQTLTNKTLAAPTVTGTLAGASETLSGTLGVTGNATVGGTLGVTGAVTTSAAVTVGTDINASGVKLNKSPLFIGYQNTPQAIANNTFTVITMDTEVVDTVNGHDLVTNPSRYTAQVAGYYEVIATAVMSANTAGLREARVYVNGAPTTPPIWTIQNAPSVGQSLSQAVGIVFLNVGDYVEAVCAHTSGAALNTGAGSSLVVKWVSA